jgi:hypothetical protein
MIVLFSQGGTKTDTLSFECLIPDSFLLSLIAIGLFLEAVGEDTLMNDT